MLAAKLKGRQIGPLKRAQEAQVSHAEHDECGRKGAAEQGLWRSPSSPKKEGQQPGRCPNGHPEKTPLVVGQHQVKGKPAADGRHIGYIAGIMLEEVEPIIVKM